MTAASGLVLVDKPAGLTSHDVVARVRRLASTRRVGHAGTLDPAATGLLVLGLEKGTRLLGHLTLTDKDYAATVRLGLSTLTDDAEGEPTGGSSAAAVGAEQVAAAVRTVMRRTEQVPSSVSAIKVGGTRSYARVRAGQEVRLPARPVLVSAFDVHGLNRPEPDLLDVEVTVTCSSGTYVRALARDLGVELGCGGHLTVLRRTRAGRFDLSDARTLDQLAESLDVVPLAVAVAESFPRVDVDAAAAAAVGHGRALPAHEPAPAGPVGVFGPGGDVLALMTAADGVLRPLVVFAAS
jgi:tRNA pseudouridine55 synthase